MKCSICSKEIVLSPSAQERATKFGGNPSDYTKLFTTHSKCAVDARTKEATTLMRRLASSSSNSYVLTPA